MNAPQAKKSRNFYLPIPNELITHILSFSRVKSLMRFSCMNKSTNALLYNRTFIEAHLNKSARNPQLTLFSSNTRYLADCSVIPIPVHDLLKNLPLSLPDDDPSKQLKDKDCCWVVGSCNGLICLLGFSSTFQFRKIWFRLWNPATKTISNKFGHYSNFTGNPLSSYLKYVFGYDNVTRTYQVVLLCLYEDDESASWRKDEGVRRRVRRRVRRAAAKALWRSDVMVISFGVHVTRRDLQSLPVLPLRFEQQGENDGVYLNGTVNWLALHNNFSSIIDWEDVTVDQFVILSLNLGTDGYSQLKVPYGFDEVPRVEPIVCVLMKCLCFAHNVKRSEFVIWKMTKFGVEETWTRFLKIRYQNIVPGHNIAKMLGHYKFQLFPLCLSEDGTTLIVTNNLGSQAYLCNVNKRGKKKAVKINITNGKWWAYAKDYVESLVLTP